MIEGAVIALAVALAAAVGGLLAFGLAALSARKDAGAAQTANATLTAERDNALANAKTQSARADDEKRRADALDHLLADAAVAGPVDGAYDRLMSQWRAAAKSATAGAGAPSMPSTGAPAGSAGPDDALLRPGD